MRQRLLAYLAVALCLGVVSGCSDMGTTLQITADCEPSPVPLLFGQVATNDSADRTLTIRNAGSVPLSGDVMLSCAAFTVLSGGGSFTLSPGQSRSVTVRFLPATAGTYACNLNLGTGCGPVAMSGVAQDPVPASMCELAPSSIDFGTIAAGTTLTRNLVIRSVGTATLEVNIASPCSEFEVVTLGGPQAIAPGDSLTVPVRFQPATSGSFNCSIDLGTTCSDLAVTGVGSAPQVSYATDIQLIFNTRACVACHSGPAASGGLDLSPGVSYANLVNRTSFGYAPAVRVKPFEPVNSVLYGKLAFTGQFGQGMPQGSSIPPAEVEKVRQWILAGAPNN